MPDIEGVNGQRTEFKVVGKPNLPGKLSYSLATGRARFGIDYVADNMLHAKFLRSPHANAAVKSVDISQAKALPGVVDIITWEDPDIKALGGGGGMMMGPAQPYLDNLADQEGAEVAVIVVAESEDICEEALRQLKVEWEVLPHVVDLREGIKPDAPIIRTNPKGKGNVTVSNRNEGDVEAGFREADQIIEYDFNIPAFSSHIPNPSGSVAWWFEDQLSGEGKSLNIEGAVQMKDQVGGMYKLPADKVVQEGLFQGGKYCDWGARKSQNITPLLARRTGRPVRMVCNRYEMYDFGMNQRLMHLKVGFKNNGLITAIDDFSIADGGVRGSSSFGTSGDQSYGPYVTTKCLNIRQSMDIVNSNRGKMYTSGQHCPFNWDALTMGLHLIAEKLGKDPIDIATLNIHGPKSQTDPTIPPSYQVCVDAGKKLMNWQWHATGAKKLPDGRMHGASFRYQMCPRHAFSGYTCKLELKNGRVHMPTKGPCTGIYAVEGNAMVVAEELGLRYEDISIDFDYRETFTPVGGGSDGTTASAWAMKETANLLKKQILEAAIRAANNPPAQSMFAKAPAAPSPFKGLSLDDLDIQDGNIFVKSDPGKSLPLARATAGAYLVATFSGRPPNAIWSIGMGKMFDTMNVAMCEVAVDTETGEVEIIRFVVAADPGKIIRRTSLESQIHQVMFFSGGCQLSEDYFYDKATGVKLNANMFDYKKPTILDMAPVDMELLETRAGNAAYGASGISHSLANTHLVICAIQNAIGKWIDPPATPDKVLKALGKA